MSAALAVWSARVEPGKKAKLVAQADIRITGAALDAKLADEKARSSVKLTYMTPQAAASDDEDDEADSKLPPLTSTVLCSLTPGKIEQSSLDLVINEDDAVEFEVIGKNAIYLSGNYITQPTDFPAHDSELESDEESYDLRDVSSDVELNPSELDNAEIDSDQDDSHRFEEIKAHGEKEGKKTKKEESSPSSKKRPRESDAAESGTDGEPKLSKKQMKKLKKLKAENGQAVSNVVGKQEEKPEMTKEAKNEKAEKKKDEKKDSAQKKGEITTTPSGLKIRDVKTGTGKAAKKGDLVSMRYIGKFTDGKVFDSNTTGKPFSFKLGNGEVIKGWDEGIVGMQAGGERLLIIPPNLGYGSRKHDGIPASSTLRFECKLLAIKS